MLNFQILTVMVSRKSYSQKYIELSVELSLSHVMSVRNTTSMTQLAILT